MSGNRSFLATVLLSVAAGLVLVLLAPPTAAMEPQVVTEARLRGATDRQRQGLEALRRGRFEAAREAFREALALVPGFPEAHAGLGHLAMHDGDYAAALSEYEKAEQGYRELGSVLRRVRFERYADSREEIRRIDDRLRELRRALARIESGAANPRQVQMQAQVRQRITQLEDRRTRLEALSPPGSEEIADVPAEIYFYQGNALFNLGRVEDAIARWEQAVGRNPDLAPAYNNLAAGWLSLGQPALAREIMVRAVSRGLPVNDDLRAAIERGATPRSAEPATRRAERGARLLEGFLPLVGGKPPAGSGSGGTMRVPGGIAAIAQIVPSVRTEPGEFAASLNRILLHETPRSLDWRASTPRLVLDGLGRIARAGDRLGGFPLRFEGGNVREHRRFASLARAAGWAARPGARRVTLTPVQSAEAAARRRATRLLGWDLEAAAERLARRETVELDLPADEVPSLLPLDVIAQLVSAEVDVDEAFRVLVTDPRTGLVGDGWRLLDQPTRQRIDRRAVTAFRDRSPWRFRMLAPVLRIDENGLRLPGGPDAAAAWRRIVGADPTDAPAFLQALAGEPGGRAARLFRATAPLEPERGRRWVELFAREGIGPEAPLGALLDVTAGPYPGPVADGVPLLLRRITPEQALWLAGETAGLPELPGSRHPSAPALALAAGIASRNPAIDTDCVTVELLLRAAREHPDVLYAIERLPVLDEQGLFDHLVASARLAAAVRADSGLARDGDLQVYQAGLALLSLGLRSGTVDPGQAGRAFADWAALHAWYRAEGVDVAARYAWLAELIPEGGIEGFALEVSGVGVAGSLRRDGATYRPRSVVEATDDMRGLLTRLGVLPLAEARSLDGPWARILALVERSRTLDLAHAVEGLEAGAGFPVPRGTRGEDDRYCREWADVETFSAEVGAMLGRFSGATGMDRASRLAAMWAVQRLRVFPQRLVFLGAALAPMLGAADVAARIPDDLLARSGPRAELNPVERRPGLVDDGWQPVRLVPWTASQCGTRLVGSMASPRELARAFARPLGLGATAGAGPRPMPAGLLGRWFGLVLDADWGRVSPAVATRARALWRLGRDAGPDALPLERMLAGARCAVDPACLAGMPAELREGLGEIGRTRPDQLVESLLAPLPPLPALGPVAVRDLRGPAGPLLVAGERSGDGLAERTFVELWLRTLAELGAREGSGAAGRELMLELLADLSAGPVLDAPTDTGGLTDWIRSLEGRAFDEAVERCLLRGRFRLSS